MNAPSAIAIVGLWHLGEVYAACLAELGHHVIGIDRDQRAVRALASGEPPLAEPGLHELLTSHRKDGRLSFTTDHTQAEGCETVWLTFDTPVNEADEVQLDSIFDAVEDLVPHLREDVLVVVSSQIPIGTSEKVCSLIRARRPDLSFHYAYIPENLRLGVAVQSFMQPGRIVIGAADEAARERAERILSPLGAPFMTMTPASAEMAKHALNAFLATSISFANDIADLCETYGANAEDVFSALKSEQRIGAKAYLFAGLGFSGATLARDVQVLISAGEARKVSTPVMRGVLEKNRGRNAAIIARLERELGGIQGKTLALFGVTYKAGTPTLRRSQPLEIENGLRGAGATLRLYDPLALPDEVRAVTPSPFSNDAFQAVENADAIIVLSPLSEIRSLDYSAVRSRMRGRLIFDACNALAQDHFRLEQAGFEYRHVGQ